MESISGTADQQYAALVRRADDLIVGLDFDGTLAPIVEDPDAAHMHPEMPEVLIALAEQVRAIAVITGRPARKAVALAGLDEVGERIFEHGRELFVLGQYGNERWTSTQRRVISPKPPPGLSSVIAALPRLLRRADADAAYIEEKGLSVAVHTRRLPDPEAAFERLLPVLREAAERHGLGLEPGRRVIEVRAAGMDKGLAVRSLATELGARAFLFVGDDLGDLPAFAALQEMGQQGGGELATLRVCSGSSEVEALRQSCDAQVDGPDGVLELLRQLDADIRAARG